MWNRVKSAVLVLPFVALSTLTFASGAATELTEEQIDEAQAYLDALAEDYRNDPMAINSTFGIKLGDVFWTVSVERRETAQPRGRLTDHVFGPHQVHLVREAPSAPTWYFEIASLDVLRKIASGEVKHADGSAVSEPLAAALVTEDGRTVYPIEDDIPIMLEDQAISAMQIPGW